MRRADGFRPRGDEGSNFMRRLRAVSVAICWLVPSVVFAQASITGVVKDASGAVLPGVTVEASSPALIEKVRAAVTDEVGRYRIVDLRSGTYAVSFALTGFHGSWLTPTSVLQPRFGKFSAQIDF